MKGCRKKILMLRSTGSEFFDEAYFIIKDRVVRESRASESEMIREANRIVNDNLISGYFRREGMHTGERGAKMRVFATGIGCGILAAMLIFLVTGMSS